MTEKPNQDTRKVLNHRVYCTRTRGYQPAVMCRACEFKIELQDYVTVCSFNG